MREFLQDFAMGLALCAFAISLLALRVALTHRLPSPPAHVIGPAANPLMRT